MTGVQFSLPLIDFGKPLEEAANSWGSVLITPDRLPRLAGEAVPKLGFSSHYP